MIGTAPRFTVRRYTCAQQLARMGYNNDPDWRRPIETDARHPIVGLKVAVIREVVAGYFGLTVRDMTGPERRREIARPRQIAMYLCWILTERSLPDIGSRFGSRDHTTVMHARRQIIALRAIDPEVDRDVERIIALLRERQRA